MPWAHGMAAISTSLSGDDPTSWSWQAGTVQYCANAPSNSEPITRILVGSSSVGSGWLIGQVTRAPSAGPQAPWPSSTTSPHRSPPWISGKRKAPAQPPASTSPAGSTSAVPPVMAREYQPILVLMSVLFTPAASTRTSTSPGPGRGVGRESFQTSLSGPPWPISCTPFMVAGIATAASGHSIGRSSFSSRAQAMAIS